MNVRFFLWELQSPTSNHGPPDQDGLHGLALELPVASCPPGQGTWLDLVRCSRRLLIRWWAVVLHVEGEVDIQSANNVADEEGESRRRVEEEVHREEVYMEGSGSEWEEERSSSSLDLQSTSPKSPPIIPDSPNARAYLTALNSGPQ